MTTSSISSRTRGLASAGALLLLAAALAACGGSSDGSASAGASGSTTGAGATDANGRPDMTELRACLEEQGVTLPSPPAGGDGAGGQPPADGAPPSGGGFPGGEDMSDAERQKLQAAMEECGGSFGPPGGASGARGGPNVNSAAFRTALTRYVACVRKNGFDMPDPDTSGDGPVFDADDVDREDPDFVAANATCQRLLAAARPGGADGPSQ